MNGILAWGNRGLSRFHAVRQVTENLNTSGKEGKSVLKTIEVEIDKNGRIHPLEPLSFIPSGRAYLTLLPATERSSQTRGSNSTAAKALELLASSRFAQRPTASPDEVMQRIDELRNDWGGH